MEAQLGLDRLFWTATYFFPTSPLGCTCIVFCIYNDWPVRGSKAKGGTDSFQYCWCLAWCLALSERSILVKQINGWVPVKSLSAFCFMVYFPLIFWAWFIQKKYRGCKKSSQLRRTLNSTAQGIKMGWIWLWQRQSPSVAMRDVICSNLYLLLILQFPVIIFGVLPSPFALKMAWVWMIHNSVSQSRRCPIAFLGLIGSFAPSFAPLQPHGLSHECQAHSCLRACALAAPSTWVSLPLQWLPLTSFRS